MNIPGFEQLKLIHESGPRVIYRGLRQIDSTPVLIKTLRDPYPKNRELAEIRHEYNILDRLNINGVIRVYSLESYGEGNLAIAMEPFGISLADLINQRNGKQANIDQCISITIRIAKILGQLHENDFVHKDIKPSNILIELETEELRLIDFGITSELSRERQSIILPERLEGSLAYISPEQTGRMNRDLDYRSDYYSLGITLFELLTGELPFQADNSIEWVHRHISQPPPEAHEIAPNIPEVLSQIISKLMAKNAEDRYQSTYGLIADLERCRIELAETGTLTSFELASADISRKFHIPQKLYGRETELMQLETSFANVIHGATELLLIAGYSGVGKTALVNELGKSIVRGRGYLVQGKFDQYHQSSAYGAFSLALSSLIQQILSEPTERLAMWRKTLCEALGVNGQLIIEMVPELELIIGEQPPIQELPPAEAQNRIQIVLLNFIKVFTSEEHPLVIFLDDLQWSDIPSLNLIQHLVTSREMSHLFIIGAYRSNEVDVSHPLQVRLDQIRQAREFSDLTLPPLERIAVEQMIVDTLHGENKALQVLVDLIYEKAQGNPFFIKELLKRLNEDRAITFSPEKGCWDWDIDIIRQANVSENVIDFMVSSLRRLSSSTQRALQLAACIGNSFDLHTLSIINEQSMQKTSVQLNEALKRNMLVPLNENYKYASLDTSVENSNDTTTMNPRYKFQHDRMQQAAYALIEPDQKKAVHLAIGRLMKQHGSENEIDERLMDIVDHLNAGRELIESPEESHELACLNLKAGRKAQRSSAYESAYHLLTISNELLPVDAWRVDYDLKFDLCNEMQQCAYQTGNHTEADEWTVDMLDHARTPLEKAEILSTRTRQYATLGRMQESIQAAIAGLSLLGVDLIEAPSPDDINQEISHVTINLQGRTIAELIDAPEISDPEILTAIRLLMEIFPAAFLSGSGNLFPYLVLTLVNLSLRHGSSPESAFAYGAYGMLLCGSLNDPALGYQYGKLSVAMNERFDDITLKSRIIYVYAMFIHHWNESWATMTPWFLKGIESGYQSGDLLYLAYSAQDCIIWDPTLDLETASEQQKKYLAIVRDCKFQDSLDSGTLFLQMQLNFRGLTEELFSMNNDSFDEKLCVEGMLQRRFMTGIANYNIYKAEIHYFYDDYAGALKHLKDEDHLIASSMSLPQAVRFRTLAFLARSALFQNMNKPEQEDALKKLQANLAQMTMWANNCQVNFEHLRLLMEAELARLEDRMQEALSFYEQAISAAKESGFRRDEAMANELTAKYLLNIGLTKAAEGYLNSAHYLYYRWGANRKVEQLEQKYPNILFSREIKQKSKGTTQKLTGNKSGVPAATQTFIGTTSAGFADLDMNSVLKASQAISGEINIEKLLKTTLQIVVENAGAQKAYYVVRENDQLVIHAQYETGWENASTTEIQATPVKISAEGLLPSSVVNNVIRNGKPVVLSDASESNQFANDVYFIERKPKSVICIPILRHGQFEAVIYMENNLATDAFTENRVEIINLLSAQASISMENASLFEDQRLLTEAYERFVPKQFLKLLEKTSITDVKLGDFAEREITTLFTDIRSFTSLSESMSPEENFRFINSYLTRMEPVIHKFNGFIDKYIGDAVMALFPTSADAAIQAAIDMLNVLREYNNHRRNVGYAPIDIGIGLNTGMSMLGTVGGQQRMDGTVISDAVNIASRVEGMTKLYGARILVTEDTLERVNSKKDYLVRFIDKVAAKGKSKPVTIFEIFDGDDSEIIDLKSQTLTRFHEAIDLYYTQQFKEAEKIFITCENIFPKDLTVQIYLKRCAQLKQQQPDQNWDGITRLQSK